MRACIQQPYQLSKQSGAALAETFVVLMIFFAMAGGAIQMAYLYQAKSHMGYVAFLAARQGAIRGSSLKAMEAGIRAGMLPMISKPIADGGAPQTSLTGTWWATAKADIEDELEENIELTILNPVAEAFNDFGGPEHCLATDDYAANAVCIPIDNLAGRRPGRGRTSNLNPQEATLLRVRVKYGVPLVVPVIGPIIAEFLSLNSFTLSDFDRKMLESESQSDQGLLFPQPRIAVEGVATIRMQTPPQLTSANISLAELRRLVH